MSGQRSEAETDVRATSWLGVIDVRLGRAVHAVAGRRAEYRPLRIGACPDADPLRLARHYRRVGVDGLYVADLDRIVDRTQSSQAAVLRLAEVGLPLWIDAGVGSAEDFAAFVPFGCDAVGIVATETLRRFDDLGRIVRAMADPRRLAVSLDLCGERVVAQCAELAECGPLEAAGRIAAAGVERIVVLDVTRVGTGGGPSTAGLCRQLKQRVPNVRIVSGGGIRGPADARRLMDAGCEHVLAGSWLHDLPAGGLHAQRND